MHYLGELISLGVAFSWTIAALASEIGSKRLGVFVMNVWRMGLALLLSALLMWLTLGQPYPLYAGGEAWMWLLLSGVVGYFFGDWCLFNSYLTIGSRMGQLFMTLAPMFAALAAWWMIGQTLSWTALVAMAVTLLGIAISVLGRDEKHHVSVNLPLKGILYGIGAGLGQGFGLVLSKIGLDHYTKDVPSDVLPQVIDYLPFGSNMIRCVAGLVCFSAWLVLSGHAGRMRESLKERKGLLAMVVAVFSGPFIGVGFSLMAVQYTAAGIASTIMAMTPIIILLPSRWLFRQPITMRTVVGAVISVIGVSLFFLL
ncbi:MAG: DMT family transporter [Prevotella sp.]|nr:DMT family transporter [Prevotella sp.]